MTEPEKKPMFDFSPPRSLIGFMDFLLLFYSLILGGMLNYTAIWCFIVGKPQWYQYATCGTVILLLGGIYQQVYKNPKSVL